MEIGVITYWETEDNYGQLLQCWAFQQYLKKEGHSPYLIRFKRFIYPKAKKKRSFKEYVKKIIKFCLVYPIILNVRTQKQKQKNLLKRDFYQFRQMEIQMSEEVYDNIESLRINPPQADIYVTGSDQVWNYNLTLGELEAFFLQFGDSYTKRISYAASIGHETLPHEIGCQVKKWLQSFDAISVRESSAVELLHNIGISAFHVLDPTLLLSANDYQQRLMCSSIKTETPYIYIYSVNYSVVDDLPWQEVKDYCKLYNWEIKVTPGSGFSESKELFVGVKYLYATIPEWIHAIANAQLIITASFHGIVFCIINNVPFIYTPLEGKHSGSNRRVLDLLNILGLQHQIWSKDKLISDYLVVDWTEVNINLEKLRTVSQTFLKEAIKA